MKLVLLGDPVAHSLSPAMQVAALRACGIAGTYTARRVDEAGLRGAVDEIRYGSLTGANVTMPHKQAAFAAADDAAADALATGAVNTLVGGSGVAVGANTDIAGVRYAWSLAGLPEDAPVLVLGAGGAAAAALVALAGRPIAVAARRSGAAAERIALVRSAARILPWGTPVRGAVVVNATTLGMAGEDLPSGVLDEAAGLLEMPYAAGTTPAERRGAQLGIPVASGTAMLLGQAMASFTLWTGQPAPESAMRSALREAQGPQNPGRNSL